MFRHTLYNLVGLGLPLVAAVFTIPLLIDALGVERFGMLALLWALVSSFGLFDLGLGRALTRELAELRARGDGGKARRLVGTALGSMVVLGAVAGLLLALGAPWLVERFGGVTDAGEAVRAIYAMAPALPFVIATAGLRGVLEADHAFGVVNAIRLPTGVYTFAAPLTVVHYGHNDLGMVAASLTAGRVVACAVHAWYCRHAADSLACWFRVDRGLLKGLLRSGGWMTVSSVVSPLMGYLDRYVIGVTIGVGAIAYYVTPNEIVTKLWIIPGALTSVLFPKFAAGAAGEDRGGDKRFGRSVLLVLAIMYPLCMLLVTFSAEILSLWISDEFANKSADLMQIFAIGVLMNSLATIPFTFIQGAGRSEYTGRIHVFELALFVPLLVVLASAFGLAGAAWAWLIRIAIDVVLMFGVASSFRSVVSRRIIALVGLAMLCVALHTLLLTTVKDAAARVFFLGIFCALVGLVSRREYALMTAERLS